MSPCKKKTGLLLSSAFMLLCSILLISEGCTRKDQPLVREGWITDHAKILSQSENNRLSASLEAYEKETCHQILVLIIPSLAGESMAEFSQRTATAWDIGQPGFGNGILLSIAMQEGIFRLETASAFDWFVEQGTSDRILKEVMVPYFKEKKYVEGIEQGLLEIMRAARLKIIPEDHRPDVCRK
ncbi:TPM domain-containing protein [Thermodesulfobacteriota bacterium]